MNPESPSQPLTSALEDYLETIYELIRERRVARVRDIAAARGVKSGSVTPALKRLRELGLIEYERREYIGLTDSGEKTARRVLARHRMLTEFLTRVLRMPAQEADRDACAMEHHLSDQAMDRLVRLFEFMQNCPDGRPNFVRRFHQSCLGDAEQPPVACIECQSKAFVDQQTSTVGLSELQPGQTGRVSQVSSQGALRQRLLDMGILPDVQVRVERVALAGDPIWIRLQGYQLSLRKQEAAAVQVFVEEP